jgi:hypothetical protein
VSSGSTDSNFSRPRARPNPWRCNGDYDTRSDRSVLSRVACALVATVLISSTGWHLAAVFLSIAPTSSVSQEFSAQVAAHVDLEFEQDWDLFAPNPMQDDIDIEVRVQVAGSYGQLQSPWDDLTADDIAHILHNPFPSHVNQNLFRRASQFYDDSHSQNGAALGSQGFMSEEYLKRIALQRIGRHWDGKLISRVQMEEETTPVVGPSWTDTGRQSQSSFRVLPWWPVTAADYIGLLQ